MTKLEYLRIQLALLQAEQRARKYYSMNVDMQLEVGILESQIGVILEEIHKEGRG